MAQSPFTTGRQPSVSGLIIDGPRRASFTLDVCQVVLGQRAVCKTETLLHFHQLRLCLVTCDPMR